MNINKNLFRFILSIFGVLLFANTANALNDFSITAPAGGEIWGGVRDINWTNSSSTQSLDFILVSSIFTATNTLNPGPGTINTGTYSFNTPNVGGPIADGSYKFIIQDHNDPTLVEVSNTFVIDNTAPTVSLSTATQVSTTSTITIVGTVSDAHISSGALVTITGGVATATGTASTSGDFSITVTLNQNATTTVSVTATDVAGNVSNASTVDISYYLPPTATVPSGTYAAGFLLELSATPGSVYYTTDGTDPTCATGTLYTDFIKVLSNQTVKAIGCYSGAQSTVSTFDYVVNIGGGNGSGGGGGGGGSSAPAPAPVSNTDTTQFYSNQTTNTPVLTPQQTSNQTPQGQVLGAVAYNFTKDLKVGQTSTSVTELQKMLIEQGFLSAKATGYFGALTKTALMKLQKKNNLPATGFFGPMTRALVNKTNFR